MKKSGCISPDNVSHPVDDCVVSYIRRVTSVTNELF